MSIYPEADHIVHGGRWHNEISLSNHKIVTGIEGWQKKMESDRVRYLKNEIIFYSMYETKHVASYQKRAFRDCRQKES